MTEHKSFLEHRHQSRLPVKIPVQFSLVKDPIELENLKCRSTSSSDLSLDGMFVKTDQKFLPGDVFRVDISLPEKSKQLFAFGEVVWGNETGVGLRLMLMEIEDKEDLKNYLDSFAPD